jgi:hypothetical protein
MNLKVRTLTYKKVLTEKQGGEKVNPDKVARCLFNG